MYAVSLADSIQIKIDPSEKRAINLFNSTLKSVASKLSLENQPLIDVIFTKDAARAYDFNLNDD